MFVAWQYAFNLYTSIVISVLLVAHWYYLNRQILLLTNNAIKEINLTKGLVKTTNNHHQTHEYPQAYCVYQSRFLVIINLGKQSLVIFKDSVANHSLSQLNRILNAEH
ncbi:conserved hypothetical protein [Isorropodon fossajaponicum endosymbiont JTNG4]|uniref:hypothetical protein n=1 Tax=Isorropodon fossajaponicum symbiont TaxID=883811 RepID=UPI001915305E|nr:hypothetical protein [Isorropodon fossajaponicum symbiont]BBB23868.1 conserved hypothetical protein [Isorropodon fossajaponicum endosymbiont JTNG4]